MDNQNINHAERVESVIAEYELGATSLGRLVNDLEALIECFDYTRRPESKDLLFKKWGILEDIYADVLDMKLEIIPEGYEKLIKGALSEIRKITASL